MHLNQNVFIMLPVRNLRVKNANHCIHSLLPPVKTVIMDLRRDCYELPKYHYEMFKNSFIMRNIYNNSY